MHIRVIVSPTYIHADPDIVHAVRSNTTDPVSNYVLGYQTCCRVYYMLWNTSEASGPTTCLECIAAERS